MNTSSPNRREFLQAAAATAAVPFLQPAPATASMPPSRRPWKWAPEPGLWETDCGDDVVAQLHAAADAGFIAFADPELVSRSSIKRVEFQASARQFQMTLGPIRCSASSPPWYSVSDSLNLIRDISQWTSGGIRLEFGTWASQALLTRLTAVWSETFPGQIMPPILCEASSSRFLSPEIIAAIVHKVNHLNCRLSIDTYRIAAAGIDVVDYMQRHADIIGHVELADFPGGHEPGSGSLDIAGIVAATALSPHDGVIGLRCGLSQPGPAGLSRLIAAARQHRGLREDGWA